MTTATAVRTQCNMMINTSGEMEDQLRGLLNHAKLIANKMNALQEKVWPIELRKNADEICKVCDIPQVGVGYLYASFFTIFDSFLREILSEEQILHYLLIAPEEMSWFKNNRLLTGAQLFETELAEKKRIALRLVHMSKHHNSITGFSDWNNDTTLDALEAEKFLAFQGF